MAMAGAASCGGDVGQGVAVGADGPGALGVEAAGLVGQGCGQQPGDQVDQVADEQSIVGVGRGPSPPRELDGREPHCHEAPVQPGGVVVEQAGDQDPPAVDAGGRVVERRRVDHRAGPVHEVGHDLQVGGPTVAVGQHGGVGPDERPRQCPEVGAAVGLVGVEHGVPAGLHRVVVLGEDGPQQAVPAAEVVLEGRGVAGAGGAVDLTQADALDAVGREQHLGGVDEPLGGRRRGGLRHSY
jgi:hypothetical protein